MKQCYVCKGRYKNQDIMKCRRPKRNGEIKEDFICMWCMCKKFNKAKGEKDEHIGN